ncbi:MAG: PorV/PorQ family protein [Elusimicrobia bacterium]|nr:PorV/PorQ family protein [Elusimicrobiota bacterium]
MRMPKRALIASLGALLAPGALFAASDEGKTAVPFLSYPQGARASGMGGAFVAVADDVSSLWWNPAGLAKSQKMELAATHTVFIEDIKTQYLAFSRPIASLGGTVGGSLTYLSIPGIEGYDASGAAAGKLTANSYALSASYATFVVPGRVAVGGSLKRIGQRLADEEGSGFAADLGVQAREDKLGAGLALQNFGPSFKIGGDSNPLPMTLRVGASYDLTPRIIGALDISKPRDGTARPHFGSEFKVNQNFHLRAGWEKQEHLGSGAGLTFGFSAVGGIGGGGADSWSGDGAGTAWWDRGDGRGFQWSFDYAFQSLGDLKEVHRISIGAKF